MTPVVQSANDNGRGSDTFSSIATMNKMTTLVLSTALLQAAMTASAQQLVLVDAIHKATWEQYRQEYPASPLCGKEEITLWSCSAGRHEYSFCASQIVTRTEGYMQYRASKSGKIVFTYPATKQQPKGFFEYISNQNGDASIEFSNGGYRYNLVDPLRGSSSIIINTPDNKTTTIQCGINQTLQINYTMRLMYDSGIWNH